MANSKYRIVPDTGCFQWAFQQEVNVFGLFSFWRTLDRSDYFERLEDYLKKIRELEANEPD